MANWSLLQEQLTGKRVVKRAKHGIHFDNGDGSVTANFSGKPCHYEEGGIWKPIDTKLLLMPDGFYGCPHSDVKIHKDGRVKAGSYQQKSTLVAAKEGVVDGDRIVREFKFGTQYLYMKEDGFRQETVITRTPTTQEAKFLIATETGELPSKYHRSDITAVDANGDIHEFTNLGQFKKWLDSAAYPVTIDPDFAGGANDGLILGSKTTYAASHSTSSSFTYTGTQANFGQRKISANEWWIMRLLFLFDTSSIGSGGTVTQANLVLNMRDRTTIYPNAYIIQNDWSALNAAPTNATHRETAFDACLTSTKETNGISGLTGGLGAKTSGNLDTAYINKTGITYYGLLSTRDYDGTEPTGAEYCMMAFSENATESYRPVLSVTYTAAAGIPKHAMYYARMRGNL